MKQKEELLSLAEKTKHYCNLLIAQSNSWQPEKKTEERAHIRANALKIWMENILLIY